MHQNTYLETQKLEICYGKGHRDTPPHTLPPYGLGASILAPWALDLIDDNARFLCNIRALRRQLGRGKHLSDSGFALTGIERLNP